MRIKTTWKQAVPLLGLVLVILTSLVTGCSSEEGKEPVVFADLGWDSVLVHNQIAAYVLENGFDYP